MLYGSETIVPHLTRVNLINVRPIYVLFKYRIDSEESDRC